MLSGLHVLMTVVVIKGILLLVILHGGSTSSVTPLLCKKCDIITYILCQIPRIASHMFSHICEKYLVNRVMTFMRS